MGDTAQRLLTPPPARLALASGNRPTALRLIYGVDRDPVVAQAGPGYWEPTPAPLTIPLDWLTDETADAAPPKLRLFPDGRVAGVVAPAGRCLLDGTGECWIVPRPADGRGSLLCAPNTDQGDYYMAHVGSTMTDEGEVATAVLAGPGGHANPFAAAQQARRHYDDTDWQVARGRYVWSDTAGDGTGGVVFVGAAYPWVTDRQIAAIRASACSVDYRWIDDEACYRLIATCLVNVGGLPSRYASLVDDGFMLTLERILQIADELGLPKMAAVTPQYESMVIDQMFAVLAAAALDDDVTTHAVEAATTELPSGRDTTTAAAEEDTSMSQRIANSGTPAPAAAPAAQTAAAAGADDAHQHAPTADGAPCSCQTSATDVVADATGAATTDVQAHTAAYEVVDITTGPGVTIAVAPPGLCYGDKITWATGVGMYSDALQSIDGSAQLAVFPEVGGVLQMEAPVLVPAGDITQTGEMYQWVEPSYSLVDNMVLDPEDDDTGTGPATSTAVADSGEEAALASAAGAPAAAPTTPLAQQSVGARLAAGRVPQGSSMTRTEARLSAAQQQHDSVLTTVVEGQARIASLVESLADTVDRMQRREIANELAGI